MNPNASVVSAPYSDALQLILAKLESNRGRLASLEKSSASTTNSATSREAKKAELTSGQEGDQDTLRDHHCSRSVEGLARSERHRSPS